MASALNEEEVPRENSRHGNGKGSLEISADIEDDYDDDEHDEDDDEEIGPSNPAEYGILEKQAAAAESELSAIRTERDRQRQQLAQLKEEQSMLLNQRGLRIERHKLQQQLLEMEQSLEQTKNAHKLAREELEQTKTHHYQLKRTLKLLQAGVEEGLRTIKC